MYCSIWQTINKWKKIYKINGLTLCMNYILVQQCQSGQIVYGCNQQKLMTNRFEYNFTRESEFEELRDRNRDLEEENMLLKQSLEELIKVNNELTESIEELNNNNYNQNNEQIEERFQMLIDQNRNLREQLESQAERNKSTKKSIIEDENQTENLVNVLEQLIESFKNIEQKHQSQISHLHQTISYNHKEYSQQLAKVQHELNNKVSTIEALSIQLKRKDEILQSISNKFSKIQHQRAAQSNGNNKQVKEGEMKKLQSKIESINKSLAEKQRVIAVYQGLLSSLKGKLLEKY